MGINAIIGVKTLFIAEKKPCTYIIQAEFKSFHNADCQTPDKMKNRHIENFHTFIDSCILMY